MKHPEHVSGWEPATSRELSDLYYKTMELVKETGVYSVDKNVELPQYEGLSVTDDPPRHELSLSADEVWQISPQAAETLCVGGPLELMYSEHCYASLAEGKFKYQLPSCGFVIYHSADSPYTRRFIEITLSGTGEAESGGQSELRDSSEHGDTPLDEALLRFAVRIKMEQQTGIDKMTSAECQALNKIVGAKARIS